MITFQTALGFVRAFIAEDIELDEALSTSIIPEEYRDEIRERLIEEEIITLKPPDVISTPAKKDWLDHRDRSQWIYWPAQRRYLLTKKNWSGPIIRSIDSSSDTILAQLSDPDTGEFKNRGLVIGYIQSGKTANYTALLAKAADVGYRFFVVLSGIDNGLRRQTQIRLKRELIGDKTDPDNSVQFPPMGNYWHEFTTSQMNGDFRRGNANSAALQGTQPVIVVVKKNSTVLRRLLDWLDEATDEVMRSIPVMVIDDEADQASIDTRGSFQIEGEPVSDDYEPPTVINSLIRDLLKRFNRCAYIGYTATPFANILIAHDSYDPEVAHDLYPKDFIISLPKPPGYYGPEELFGEIGTFSPEENQGLDVLRIIPDTDIGILDADMLPDSLNVAISDFVLGGAERLRRGEDVSPCTMLIHTSHLIAEQIRLANIVRERFEGIRDRWRYQRKDGIYRELETRWKSEFQDTHIHGKVKKQIPFSQLENQLNTFFEKVQVLVVNSETGDMLDYENEPDLKAIAIGGNRLSRGLTLEGLLCSYYIRQSRNYDTLLQMGRWFGYREGYVDLTRIYTTRILAEWFSDLAVVERTIREDLKVYIDQAVTPEEVGMRILQHPDMQVTSRAKQRYAKRVEIKQSYHASVAQTFKFPFSEHELLAGLCIHNRELVADFLQGLDDPIWDDKGPIWNQINSSKLLAFLAKFKVDTNDHSFPIPLIISYIENQMDEGELLRWTVTVRGRIHPEKNLGTVNYGLQEGPINQIVRSRIRGTNSLGVITDPSDESVDLSTDELVKMEHHLQSGNYSKGKAARHARDPESGLFIIYPISKYSGQNLNPGGIRVPIYDNLEDEYSHDLTGIALSFPNSKKPQPIEVYLEGTAPWREIE